MEKLFFLQRFMQFPFSIGSVTPSSRFLAKKMTRTIDWSSCKTIVELGAGTGVFTAELYRKKQPGASLLVFEKDPHFQEQLRDRFPSVPLYGDARHLLLALEREGHDQADIIISGIPFSILDAGTRNAILQQVCDALAPHGQFIAFQYSVYLQSLFKNMFSEVKIGFTPWNLPPAFIYYCKK